MTADTEEGQSRLLKRARQLRSRTPLSGGHTRRAACRKLAADGAAQAVPFLVSVMAGNDPEMRETAKDGLRSLSDPDAIEALLLGYTLTGEESLREILNTLGREVPEAAQLQPTSLSQFDRPHSPAEEAWQYKHARDGSILAFIPEGDFLGGQGADRVHLPPYYLALACVTNAQYAQFLTERNASAGRMKQWISLRETDAISKQADAYVAAPDKADLPVTWVMWDGAEAYCKWAGLRLPTELEWEKGARGVDGRTYPWGEEWDAARPHPPEGERKPEQIASVWAYPDGRSPYGLYQMIGNVYEWCADWYEEGVYGRYARGDTKPPAHGEHRVLRGGPWTFGAPTYLRTEYRKSTVWRGGTLLCGFRCAMSL